VTHAHTQQQQQQQQQLDLGSTTKGTFVVVIQQWPAMATGKSNGY